MVGNDVLCYEIYDVFTRKVSHTCCFSLVKTPDNDLIGRGGRIENRRLLSGGGGGDCDSIIVRILNCKLKFAIFSAGNKYSGFSFQLLSICL